MTLNHVEYDLGGRLVRFERHFKAPVDRLWAALTEPGLLAQWLARPEGSFKDGGAIALHFENTKSVISGVVKRIDAPHVLEIQIDSQRDGTQIPPEVHRATGNGTCTQLLLGAIIYELFPRPQSKTTTLRFTHLLDKAPPSGHYVLAGWHAHLDGLAEGLGREFRGARRDSFDWGRWGQLQETYKEAIL